MGRVSDTRQLTRLSAARLVAQGHPHHAITVDMIYADIQQGSRTTINDELKRWREEQDKQEALTAALPEPVAQAMLQAWAVAVEHGEQVFERRRTEIEAELEQLGKQLAGAHQAHDNALAEVAILQTSVERARTDNEVLSVELRHEREATQNALSRAAAAEERLEAARAAGQQQLDAQRAQLEEQLAVQKAQFATQEAKYREELTLATERLDGVQQHVMSQVTEARDGRRKAEDQLATAQQRIERQATDLENLRGERIALTTKLQRTQQDADTAMQKMHQVQQEKEDLAMKLASTSGRLEGANDMIAGLQRQLLEHREVSPVQGEKAALQTGSD
jgi:chromosome segregation ATPase